MVGGANQRSASNTSSEIRAILETCTTGGAGRAKIHVIKSREDSEGSRHRTKRVATSTTTSCAAVELSGSSGKPKLSADGVGVVLIELVSANSAPLSSSSFKEVDVALELAVSTDEGDSSG